MALLAISSRLGLTRLVVKSARRRPSRPDIISVQNARLHRNSHSLMFCSDSQFGIGENCRCVELIHEGCRMTVATMDLFLIRHAQSWNNARPEAERVEDPGLTELGQTQAVHLASYAASLEIDRLFTSPFRRTLETTDAIVQATALRAEIWVELHEQGGCYAGHLPHTITGRPGMSRDEIQKAYPEYIVPAAIDEFGWWKSKPYEVSEMARERASRLLRRTWEELVGNVGRVAFVMHADFKQQFLSLINDRVMDTPGNASVSHVRLSRNKSSVVQYNVIHHLPAVIRSW